MRSRDDDSAYWRMGTGRSTSPNKGKEIRRMELLSSAMYVENQNDMSFINLRFEVLEDGPRTDDTNVLQRAGYFR